MNENALNTYEITWRNKDIGATYRADGTKSDTERNNIEAVDIAEARSVFDALYGHYNYEIVSIQEYKGSAFAKWANSRVGR
jgi:hypothetical protein